MNAKLHRTLIITLLAAVLVLAGCGTLNVEVEPGSASPTAEVATPEPTEEPTAEPTDEPAEEMLPAAWSALEAAFGYILASDGPEFPAIDSGWQVENITPEQLLGSSTYRLVNGSYQVTVSYPIVLPELTVYHIVGEEAASGYRWEGDVNAQGEVVAAGTPRFEPVTFRSDPFGFEFDHPAEWTVSDQGEIGPRGSAVQFLSGDEIVMQMTLYLWDPQNDLAAYIEQRKGAWEASGMTLVAEEEWLVADGHLGVGFTLQTAEGEQVYFFLTTVADRYLELSGSPHTELVSAVAHTVRLVEPLAASDAHSELGCTTAAEGTSEWVACNVMDALISRNTAVVPSFMGEEFIIGYWLSEGVTVPAAEAPAQLANLLAADGAAFPLTFTTDQSQFPPLMDMGVAGMFGPDVAVAQILYSEGWGQDGLGAALIFIAQNEAGAFYWHGMVYSFEHFDK